MTANGIKVMTFNPHEVDKMRDDLQRWGLDGWSVKAAFISGAWVRVIIEKPLTPGDNSPTDFSKRQKEFPSFETVSKDEPEAD